MINLVGFPTAGFGGSHAILEPDLDAMLASALLPNEVVYLRVQSAPGEAMVLTHTRVIVLKGAGCAANGKAFGRYFALDEIVRFEYRGWFGTTFVAVITRVTQHERIPFWNRRTCSFGVTFSRGLGGRTAQYLRQLESWFLSQRRSALLSGPLPTVTPVGVAVQYGESFHIQVPAMYFEEKSVREYSGASSGVSVPIAYGLRVRVGKMRGHSWTRQVLEHDDSGSLLVGTSRIVFVGARRTLSIPLQSVTTVEAFADGVRVGVANRPMTLFKTEDDIPGLLLKRVLGIP
jgi:hypothetical protein